MKTAALALVLVLILGLASSASALDIVVAPFAEVRLFGQPSAHTWAVGAQADLRFTRGFVVYAKGQWEGNKPEVTTIEQCGFGPCLQGFEIDQFRQTRNSFGAYLGIRYEIPLRRQAAH